MVATPDDVLAFWFGTPAATPEELGKKMRRWYQGGPSMDGEVRERFGTAVDAAVAHSLDGAWRTHPKAWLAEIILLDQLTRNVHRNEARMYDGDAHAQALAIAALDDGRTHALPLEEWQFAMMPLVHAEDLAMQERAVVEFVRLVDAAPGPLKEIFGLSKEQTEKYREIIKRFGRFPHRNGILGRTPTPDEVEFLRDWEAKQPPSKLDQVAPKS